MDLYLATLTHIASECPGGLRCPYCGTTRASGKGVRRRIAARKDATRRTARRTLKLALAKGAE